MPDFQIRPARTDELPTALKLLDEAARWLITKNIHQWESPPPPDLINFLTHETQAQHVYLAWQPGTHAAIATFRLANADFGRWDDNGRDKALYVYSLAISTDQHKAGVGAHVLTWIRGLAEQQGRAFLRLDCWVRNHALRGYYERLGFTFRGEVSDDGYPLALYEIRLPQSSHPA